MPLKDVEARRKYDRERPHRHNKEVSDRYSRRPESRIATRNARDILKREVLGHYSKNEVAQCSWSGCLVIDVDMLTLDHIDGGGTAHRKSGGCNSGVILYRKLRRAGYPGGYQTLCFNHQWKKQMTVLREDFNIRNGLTDEQRREDT